VVVTVLAGRVAVVLGGTGGIGKAVSLALADAGANVVASSRRQPQVDATADEIERRGRRSLRLTTDVTDRVSLERLCAETLRVFGQVDILVNCAAKTKRQPTLDLPEADWHDVLDTNLTGTLRACQVFGRPMLERGYGRIVNFGSLTSFVAFHEVTAYAASKGAVTLLTKSLAVEWGARGVCVNAVAPGVIRTELNAALLDGTGRGQELLMRTPMKRFGRPEEVAAAAVFLASEGASFVNGEILAVDGGFLASGVNQ
jgi:NAD(P)-dependent dehydrogenase (short-subunit alcohol dehydrogenase family)